MNRKYELMFLIDPKLNSEEQSSLMELIENKINGNIVKKENWGKKPLAYEIKKNSEAIYLLYYVETESKNIDEVKRMVSINKQILRNLIIKHEKRWPFEMKQLDLTKIKSHNKKRSPKVKNDK